jgi:hypothetical protein
MSGEVNPKLSHPQCCEGQAMSKGSDTHYVHAESVEKRICCRYNLSVSASANPIPFIPYPA